MGNNGAPASAVTAWRAEGKGANARTGILFIHGFTGAPASMRPWAEYAHNLGYTVALPLLPGHGTKPEDLNKVKWEEWPAEAEKYLLDLFASCDRVFIAGLSMGGGTTLNLAEKYSSKISGIILVNPMIHVPRISPLMARAVSFVQKLKSSVGDDIKRPGITEYGYDALPTVGLYELLKMLKITRANLAKVECPTLLFHSVEDHVLPVSNTEIILAGISSAQKQRVELLNSYHVATLDFDAELIFENARIFIETQNRKVV